MSLCFLGKLTIHVPISNNFIHVLSYILGIGGGPQELVLGSLDLIHNTYI